MIAHSRLTSKTYDFALHSSAFGKNMLDRSREAFLFIVSKRDITETLQKSTEIIVMRKSSLVLVVMETKMLRLLFT